MDLGPSNHIVPMTTIIAHLTLIRTYRPTGSSMKKWIKVNQISSDKSNTCYGFQHVPKFIAFGLNTLVFVQTKYWFTLLHFGMDDPVYCIALHIAFYKQCTYFAHILKSGKVKSIRCKMSASYKCMYLHIIIAP